MTSSHIIFIPAMILIGIVLGFVIGARAARDSFEMELKRREEREKVKAERVARKERRAKEKGNQRQESK